MLKVFLPVVLAGILASSLLTLTGCVKGALFLGSEDAIRSFNDAARMDRKSYARHRLVEVREETRRESMGNWLDSLMGKNRQTVINEGGQS